MKGKTKWFIFNQKILFSLHRILFNLEKDGNSDPCYNMKEA